jgi:F-type H+-transporting ATPase subunit gamma
MAGLKELRGRLRSVRNTRKTTYAMKLVSAAKLKRVQDAVVASRAYLKAMEQLLGELKATEDARVQKAISLGKLPTQSAINSLFIRRPVNRRLAIVIGGSRGLAGGFNSNLHKALESFISQQPITLSENVTSLIIFGKKVSEFAKKNRFLVKEEFLELSEDPEKWDLPRVLKEVQTLFTEGKVDEVYLIYAKFFSPLNIQPQVELFLPLGNSLNHIPTPSERVTLERDIIFEPTIEDVFKYLVPKYLELRARQAALNTKASEHGSRMTAMDSATKNAEDIIYGLQLAYNKLRQSNITSELLDILGGAEAINN